MCRVHRARYLAGSDMDAPVREFARRRPRNTPGEYRLDDKGYMSRRIRIDGKMVKHYEHRDIMERELGRPLLPNENVHHKNGVRHDNRRVNLELWVRSQPSGQRVDDLVVWAKEVLARYEVSA